MENGTLDKVAVEDQPLSLSLLTSSTNVRIQALKTILHRFEDPSRSKTLIESISLTM
jgi:hypothetical protein